MRIQALKNQDRKGALEPEGFELRVIAGLVDPFCPTSYGLLSWTGIGANPDRRVSYK